MSCSFIFKFEIMAGKLLEIAISFDTTGSMTDCLSEVKSKIQVLVQRLIGDIPTLRIAICAHGDYDSAVYITQWKDFSRNQDQICQFVHDVKNSGGSTFDECYELVLHEVRENLSWNPSSKKALIMIGDATPHDKDYADNKKGIDWREELTKLRAMGVKIYSVQCQDHTTAAYFWKELADATGGHHLKLSNFETVIDMLLTICYREMGEKRFLAYKREVETRDGININPEIKSMFETLQHKTQVELEAESGPEYGEILNEISTNINNFMQSYLNNMKSAEERDIDAKLNALQIQKLQHELQNKEELKILERRMLEMNIEMKSKEIQILDSRLGNLATSERLTNTDLEYRQLKLEALRRKIQLIDYQIQEQERIEKSEKRKEEKAELEVEIKRLNVKAKEMGVKLLEDEIREKTETKEAKIKSEKNLLDQELQNLLARARSLEEKLAKLADFHIIEN